MKEPNTSTEQKEATKSPGDSSFWTQQIALAEKEHHDFWEDGEKWEKRYKCERDGVSKTYKGRRFNIIYSNVETSRSAFYARAASPDVRQRWTQGEDKLARTVGDMVERALSFSIDTTSHEKQFKAAVLDLCVPGRGIIKMCYEPTMGQADDGSEYITDQKLYCEHVYYRDFLHSPAKSWEMVWWIGFRHHMTRDDLRDQGFSDAEDVPLNWTPDGYKERECPDELRRAEVWEIWHKQKKERVWVVVGHPRILRRDDDPYGLQGFWPMPEPVQAIVANDSYVPGSFIRSYADQADELDVITDRISKLTSALKRRGVYDASVKELRRLARANDNEFIPAEGFAAFASSGGLKVAFQTEDLKPIIETLMGLYEQRDRLIQAIYETTGISDLMRGQTTASETATAQQLKANFGSARMQQMQQDVQRWVRDALRIHAEMIAEHFEPEVLMSMTGIKLPTMAEVQAQMYQQQLMAMQSGQQPPPPGPPPLTIDDVMGVLRDDKLRSYHVDIETDSTVFEDAAQEKQDRTELLTAMSQFINNWMPVAQGGGPPMMKLGMEMLSFGVRGFKAGRQMEEALDEARNALEQAAQQPQQPPPPDPAVEREKLRLQGDQQRLEADLQMKAADKEMKQMDLQIKQMDLQAKGAEVQVKAQDVELDREAKALERAHKRELAEIDLTSKQLALDFDARAREADFQAKTKLNEMNQASSKAKHELKYGPIKPKSSKKAFRLERSPDGRIIGGTRIEVEDDTGEERATSYVLERGPDGRIIGGSIN